MVHGQDAHIIDLTSRVHSPNAAAIAQARFAHCRALTCLQPAPFAAILSDLIGWSIGESQVIGWETTAVPPGDVLVSAEILAGTTDTNPGQSLSVIVGFDALQDALTSVVASAEQILSVTGSRSREPNHLERIEKALIRQPDLIHYRVLYGPPRHPATKVHLLRLMDLHVPDDRLHIGLVDPRLEPEKFMVASEKAAVIILPPLTSPLQYDTALYVNDPLLAAAWSDVVRQAWSSSEQITTRAQIEQLEVRR